MKGTDHSDGLHVPIDEGEQTLSAEGHLLLLLLCFGYWTVAGLDVMARYLALALARRRPQLAGTPWTDARRWSLCHFSMGKAMVRLGLNQGGMVSRRPSSNEEVLTEVHRAAALGDVAAPHRAAAQQAGLGVPGHHEDAGLTGRVTLNELTPLIQ